jgi:hypothetical protein
MDNKQINKDWTLREDRTPRKKDVVIDTNFLLGVVTKSEGEFNKKKLWVEDIQGNEIYTAEPAEAFRVANRDQTVSFYMEYKNNTGWLKGRIYTVKGKDYPLQLVDLGYDLVKQEMLYVFRDLTSPTLKHFKTLDESLVDPIDSWYYETAANMFSGEGSVLNHKVEIALRELSTEPGAWTVAGSAFNFPSREVAENEIQKWIDRMKIRRAASVFSLAPKTSLSGVAISQDGFLYVTNFGDMSGQPGIFNSKVAAAVALVALGETVWANALQLDLDSYDI